MKNIGVILSAFAFPVFVFAGMAKVTFNDVLIDGYGIVEIEAAIKDTKANDHSRCDYYSDDYIEWLGYYESFADAPKGISAIEVFCVDNFANRVQ